MLDKFFNLSKLGELTTFINVIHNFYLESNMGQFIF
ncbi:hypothetical protein LCGC14_1556240 [marine sediment metagenome]|uniref:Uncharacterized protein n=1 Tax=marine sediment metagenome TaxID=412755 RepID=A0A0F9INU5_9ZZZZ